MSLTLKYHLFLANIQCMSVYLAFYICYYSAQFSTIYPLTRHSSECYSHENGLPGFMCLHKFLFSLLKLAIIFQSHRIFVMYIWHLWLHCSACQIERKLKLVKEKKNIRNCIYEVLKKCGVVYICISRECFWQYTMVCHARTFKHKNKIIKYKRT